jgi:hypothetical protein
MKKFAQIGVVCGLLICFGQGTTVSAKQIVATSTVATLTASTSTQNPAEIEKRVREYFADVPVMIEIARCESKFRQYTDAGNVLRGGGSTGMVGIFQFYELIHKAPALALGYDIETVEGNLGYAKHVYKLEGTRPWASCVPDVIPVPVVMSDANKELQIKLLTKVVELLTELLKMELGKK